MWQQVLLYIGVSLLLMLLAPKPKRPKPASLEDFQVPTAEPDRAIPVIFGTVFTKGPNVVWYGDLRVKSIREGGGFLMPSVIIGYKYFLGAHFAISYPVDSLLEIQFDERTAWTGTQTTGSFTIDKPTLFGGKKEEGGVSGTVTMLDGSSTQAKNDYLVSQLGADIPAFRGVMTLVFEQFYWGNSPYIKSPAFKIKRTQKHTDGSAMWNITKADISGNLNAAHIIRECLTNWEWGMGYPTGMLDDTSFTSAANTLYTEGFGLSLIWSESEPIESFLQTILDHIEGVIDTDPGTGKITLKLIRADYTASEELLIDESNTVAIEEFERRGWGETVNELTVTYRDQSVGKDIPITVHDTGNVQLQGGVVAQSVAYPGIPNGDLAYKVAYRDLKVLAAPLAKLKITVDRTAYALKRGDVFRFSNARYGMSEVVFRVISLDRGRLEDGKIQIDAVEDVFGTPTNVWGEEQPTEWTPPNTTPVNITYQQTIEAGYYDIQTNMTAEEIAGYGASFGFVLAHAVRPANDAYDYEIWSRTGVTYVEHGLGEFCPSATLVSDLPEGSTFNDVVVNVENWSDPVDIVTGGIAYIGSECVKVEAYNVTAGTITIDRGVLDTIPDAHTAGARVWFVQDWQGLDTTEWTDGNTVYTKLLPRTSLGTLDIGSATQLAYTVDARYQRPYPPGNVKINTEFFPSTAADDITVTWSHRQRTNLTIYNFGSGNVGPEAGTTYTLRIYNETNNLIREETGLTGTSYLYDTLTELADDGKLNTQLRIVLFSVRDGYASRQSFDWTFSRTLTTYYRVTDTADQRTTSTGDTRVTVQ